MATRKPSAKPTARSKRPIVQLLDALGKRWALRILWELRSGALSFRALRDACDAASPSVLNQRLGELRDLGYLSSTDSGYELTDSGRELGALLLELDGLARRHMGPTRR